MLRNSYKIVLEGLHFLWSIRKANRAYLQWRLGTVYGSFTDKETFNHRSIKSLLKQAWKDRQNVYRFLLWRRRMRHGQRR